jgi:UDP-N-acetylmuramoyl-tripeptide--D-alanyl-D-alanine ligase
VIPLTVDEIVRAVGGRLLAGEDAPAPTGVSTDTRALAAGDLYVPLAGERFDGHAFAADALARGAAGVLLDESAAAAGPVADSVAAARARGAFAVAVPHTLRALGDLARAVVRRSPARVVAITGSMGKTTVKGMVAHLLGAVGPVCATLGNFNNLVGLPLSVFRTTRADRFLVLEMGMSEPGEIARLAAIAPPHVGLVTNVAEVHLEQLRTLEAVADAKGELYRALAPGAVAVVNLDDPHVRAQAAAAGVTRRLTFGAGRDADVQVGPATVRADGTPEAWLTVRGERVRVALQLLGAHAVWNAAAALAAVLATLGDAAPSPAALAADLAGFAPAKNRGERFVKDGVTWLSDCYNANPRATKAALETLAGAPVRGRRVAVLGDMRELGDHAPRAHSETGAAAAALGVDRLVAVGEWARTMADGATAAGLPAARVATAADVLDMADDLRGWLRDGDWVLVKGSRGARMERLLEALGVTA